MTRKITVLFCVFVTLFASAQETFTNKTFGFAFNIPNDWGVYGTDEFNKDQNECHYFLILPIESGYEIQSEWDMSVTITAKANGFARTLDQVVLFERQRLHREHDEIIVELETDSSLLVSMEIMGKSYKSLTLFNFQNGIAYLVTYSNLSGNFEKSIPQAQNLFKDLAFFVPEVSYSELTAEIAASTGDASLLHLKAKREFDFHQFESSLDDCNKTINLFPEFGDAYYLKGYLLLYAGDTLESCRNFYQSVNLGYGGDLEIDEYCNTRRISEALYPRPNPFKDFDPTANHLDYVDSVKQHKYFILSFHGDPSEEIISYVNHLNHLFALEFEQLDSLFNTEKGILQLYTFGAICKKYPEKITETHKVLLKSKSKTKALTRSSSRPKAMPTSEIAESIFGLIEKSEKERIAQEQTEYAVRSFIQNYAKYPESYVSISFHEFHIMSTLDLSTGKTDENSENYVIGHRYRLKNAKGEIMDFYNTFKLTYDFKMNIIEGEETNTTYSFPPKILDWLEKHGRELSEEEKKELEIE